MGQILETAWHCIEIVIYLCLSRHNELTLNLLWTNALTKKKVVVPADYCRHHTDRNTENKATVVSVPLEQAPSIGALRSELGTAEQYQA